MKTLKDLAQFVHEKEKELAYGSETCLLGAFANDYGHVTDVLNSDSEISNDDYQLWVSAYATMVEYDTAGRDYIVGDLF